jgi:CubicO group peptidase (beta-lactamase class C family)
LRENITKPLGMDNTGVDSNGLLTNRVYGYDKNFVTGIAPAQYTEMTWAFGAGDMYSTLHDLFFFDQALYTEKLLPASLRDEMFKLDDVGKPASLGWFVSKAPKGHPAEGANIIAHEGNVFGFFTMFTRIPERRALVIIMDNTHQDEFPAITRDALAVLYGKEPSDPKPLALEVVAPVVLKDGAAEAIAKYKSLKATKADAYEFGGLFTLGENLLSAGRPKDALEIFRFAFEENPKSWSALYGQVVAHLALGQSTEAAASCKKLVQMSPNNPFATYATEKVRAAQGK